MKKDMKFMKEKIPEEVKMGGKNYYGRWYGLVDVGDALNQLIRFLKEFLSEDEPNCYKGPH